MIRRTFSNSRGIRGELSDYFGSHELHHDLGPLACLRAAPFKILNTAFSLFLFLTIVDSALMPKYNSVALAEGNFVKVPLIIGINTNEGKLFASYGEHHCKVQNSLSNRLIYPNE